MDMTNKEHFRTIRKAIENNKLTVFIGSGISYDSKLPSWEGLIRLMENSLELPGTDDYLKIAEYYYLQFGRNTYYNKINDFFPSESQPNDLHELLLSLKPQHIITTNWDDLLEKSIRNKGELYFPVVTDHELAASPSSRLLIKMHGDLAHRNIIFKESDYLAYTERFPLIENFIKSLFSTQVVIFIGYSINDYNLNQVLSWIRNRTQDAPPSFTILTKSKITISESKYLREKGIYPLLYEGSLDSLSNKYPLLSEKSLRIAKTLEKISLPENLEVQDILSEIAEDISSWVIVSPSMFVQLYKDRLNVTEVNKIYYDSAFHAIIYNLSDDEKNYSRTQYRRIRKCLTRILRYLPEVKIHLRVSYEKKLIIKNVFEFEFEDEYTKFCFNEISNRVEIAKISSMNNLDKSYQLAYDNYYLKRLVVARDAFLHLANHFFSKSLFIKSLISAFNKKHLCFGEISYEDSDIIIKYAMEEQLSKNDNISEMIEKFPKSIISRQKPLFQGLDSNNSFLLESFKKVANLSREIDVEIAAIKSGSMVFSNKLTSLHNQVYCIIMFINKNKITTFYSTDYKNIAKLGFESIIKRQVCESAINLKQEVEPDIVNLDVLLSYLGIISFKENDLVKFLSDNLSNDRSLLPSPETIKYLLGVLDNSLDAISSTNSRSLCDYCIKVWSNSLILLSYVKHNASESKEIFNRLIRAIDTQRWFDLSEAINRFLVFQVNRYSKPLSVDDYTSLFNKQIEKLNVSEELPFRNGSRLFSNLLSLIMDNNHNDSQVPFDETQLERFILNISSMNLTEKLRVINGFVFAIHTLTTGELKSKVINLLKQTFEDAKKEAFGEQSIIYGLDLYNIGVLNDTDLEFLLNQLQDKADNHIEKGSISSHYPFIKEQLLRINKSKLKDFKKVVESVSKISTAVETSFSPFANPHNQGTN